MKFFILYAVLQLNSPITLDLSQEVIPRLKLYKAWNMALNPFDNSTPEEKSLQKLGYLDIENNVQLNYVYSTQ